MLDLVLVRDPDTGPRLSAAFYMLASGITAAALGGLAGLAAPAAWTGAVWAGVSGMLSITAGLFADPAERVILSLAEAAGSARRR